MEISIITGEAMRESLLSPKLYQALKYILAVTLIIILILPLPAINQKKILLAGRIILSSPGRLVSYLDATSSYSLGY